MNPITIGADGNRKVYKKTIKIEGKTETERYKKAEKDLAKFITDIENNNYTEPSRLTLESYSKMWIKTYTKNKELAPKTVFEYKRLLELRIIPSLGHLKLNKFKPIHLVKFMANLNEEGMSLKKTKKKLSSNTLMHYY
ncbi:phage integrase [Clostridium pasteurianum DSM 525 = ATCC 6013]|uniref:Phage integrase n=1 Tax=Clostridium pasteurianum DSM 525 = ATCC 6013 TaxID=1262449 RepID=A0A0H3J804_CLOPA|nr:N-terminal phage integrase SAM-like domain-containing protein [Clostridium pasteurianum]AJA50036.1 phage integrase [Clostridium pasteurianum DSM 525 = ATCC 6013]AJA54024.1 phage integrase [Clostridium pasteurianum DSM 525 = ATCC 6013]AOZ77162.1 hypothetical protein AQ983_19475 [Clostridium pasteurianum DSM 525 = ATCC 6013]AOZ80959.1 hypothetical protein AQ984_19470 [Clostridium pasteurianum]KRU13951.1 hypothetical protein CP6013_03207 [Clostridium pasteurianum DSM 525 = ATCC 6013]